MALAAKFYWAWYVEQDQLWARILLHKYLHGIPKEEAPQYPLVGSGSVIWGTLKKGATLIKEGLFWICKKGIEALFWSDSWDGFLPIVSQFPSLLTLCQHFLEVGWSRVSDFKSFHPCGQLEVVGWKTLGEWSVVGLEEDCVELHSILSSRHCISLKDKDSLAWCLNPKGVFTVASGYQELLAHRLNGEEVHWWKYVWNKFSWSKCNCFVWTLAWNRYLTWEIFRSVVFMARPYVFCVVLVKRIIHTYSSNVPSVCSFGTFGGVFGNTLVFMLCPW